MYASQIGRNRYCPNEFQLPVQLTVQYFERAHGLQRWVPAADHVILRGVCATSLCKQQPVPSPKPNKYRQSHKMHGLHAQAHCKGGNALGHFCTVAIGVSDTPPTLLRFLASVLHILRHEPCNGVPSVEG